uniref:Prokaryotic-type class I peptide chain release factors domain-containing protein n=1 Tax=Trypanosoma vivax (strain Y486) TaxID=1055687 RepID=G0TWS0_TRYVY|nr:conserved hypothetical protein [Trypanosoma vivax Y486]
MKRFVCVYSSRDACISSRNDGTRLIIMRLAGTYCNSGIGRAPAQHLLREKDTMFRFQTSTTAYYPVRLGLRWFFARASLMPFTAKQAIFSQMRRSQISSFKKEGYFRIASPKEISIDDRSYTILVSRGGGPGGQGCNSSSNKVELRVRISELSSQFDERLIENLRNNERGKSLTADETLLIITSHEHRSMHQNKEMCLQRLREFIHKASWVPPVEAGPIKRPATIVEAHKAERRKKSAIKKMRQMARRGLW